jgi:hypothetical protein
MLNKMFLSPFALPCPSKLYAKTGSVRRKTNVSKGTGNLINYFSMDLSFDTFLLRKNTQDERSYSILKNTFIVYAELFSCVQIIYTPI